MKSEKQNKNKLISDFAIIATTATAVGLMNFQPPLSYSKKTALDFLFYFGSGMVSIRGKKLIDMVVEAPALAELRLVSVFGRIPPTTTTTHSN